MEGRDLEEGFSLWHIVIGIILVVMTIVIIFLFATPARAMDSIALPKQEFKSEPFIAVERYSPPDYQNDPEVLISKPKIRLILEPVENVKVVEKIVYRDRLVIDKPHDEVKVTATWESD